MQGVTMKISFNVIVPYMSWSP